MKRQSSSCKNIIPLGRINRIQDSDSSDSSSSKQIGENSSIETTNISAPLNHEALGDKENETSRFRRLHIANESNDRSGSFKTQHDVQDSSGSLESAELVQIHNQSKSFTSLDWKRIEKIEKQIDMSGRTCLPFVKNPISLTDVARHDQDCIRPSAFSYRDKQDYNELIIAAHQQRHHQQYDDRDRKPSDKSKSVLESDQRYGFRSDFISSTGSAFHVPRRT